MTAYLHFHPMTYLFLKIIFFSFLGTVELAILACAYNVVAGLIRGPKKRRDFPKVSDSEFEAPPQRDPNFVPRRTE